VENIFICDPNNMIDVFSCRSSRICLIRSPQQMKMNWKF